jgi:hypothetical protein
MLASKYPAKDQGMRQHSQQYTYLFENPGGYCPNHATGVKLPEDLMVTPLQYVD